MTEAETVAQLIAELDGDPFVHVRFGDGDVFFATGTGPVLTGDGEEWCQELSDYLILAWRSLAAPKRLFLGDLRSYAVSDGCELEWDDLLMNLVQLRQEPLTFVHMEALRVGFGRALPFYLRVRNDGRRKCFVGPARLQPVAAMLGCEHIVVPLRTAWRPENHLPTLLDITAGEYELALFAAGRGGKIMQGWLAIHAPDLTQIDVGSGLDLLIDDGVRRGTDLRVDRKAILEQYREVGLCP